MSQCILPPDNPQEPDLQNSVKQYNGMDSLMKWHLDGIQSQWNVCAGKAANPVVQSKCFIGDFSDSNWVGNPEVKPFQTDRKTCFTHQATSDSSWKV